MFENYLKTALRNLLRHKQHSFINILGLAIGMASVILILLFVREELSTDRFQTNRDRIYRVLIAATNLHTGATSQRAIGPYRLATELKPDFADFDNIIRFAPDDRLLITHKGETYYEEKFAYVDDKIFEMFSFELLSGNPGTALQDPFSVVISEEIAQKYFGDENPIGKALHLEDNDFNVTGVLAPIPGNTQFDFNILASINCGDQVFSRIILENWGENFVETYVMLPAGKTATEYQDRLDAFIAVKLESWKKYSPQLVLQPLGEMYLNSQNIASFFSGGDITYVYAFSAIALFILIIACINFMNLATARSANRAKEVGLRKVVGAQRGQLIWQFLGESVMLSTLALGIALFLVFLSLPAFNDLAGKSLTFSALSNSDMPAFLILTALLVGIVAGSYPAMFLSAFQPVSILSGALTKGVKGGLLRKILVTFQFTISIFLIVVTAIIYRQLEYSRNAQLGYDKEHVVLLPGTSMEMREKYEPFRTELLSNPSIINAAASSRVPPERLRSSLGTRPEGIPEDQREGMQTIWTDFDFIETMKLELASGRSFSREHGTDAGSAFILNETAVKKIGWTNESAIGKGFGSSEIRDWDVGQWEKRNGHVVGVLKDFHFESMHQKIVPTVYFVAPYMAWSYVIRIAPENIPQTLAFIEGKWQEFNPEQPFVYSFVDEEFDELYRAEERQSKMFSVFAVLAIFVACLGLVGLASFTAEQRTKEVGIRKVLGATVSNLTLLITREFTWLVLIAFVLAAPGAWYFMDKWLQDFAYHISLGAGIFIISGLVCLVIAWLTVSYQAIKVALTNPADALRYE